MKAARPLTIWEAPPKFWLCHHLRPLLVRHSCPERAEFHRGSSPALQALRDRCRPRGTEQASPGRQVLRIPRSTSFLDRVQPGRVFRRSTATLGLPATARTRKPAVAKLDHSLHGVFAFAAKQS